MPLFPLLLKLFILLPPPSTPIQSPLRSQCPPVLCVWAGLNKYFFLFKSTPSLFIASQSPSFGELRRPGYSQRKWIYYPLPRSPIQLRTFVCVRSRTDCSNGLRSLRCCSLGASWMQYRLAVRTGRATAKYRPQPAALCWTNFGSVTPRLASTLAAMFLAYTYRTAILSSGFPYWSQRDFP